MKNKRKNQRMLYMMVITALRQNRDPAWALLSCLCLWQLFPGLQRWDHCFPCSDLEKDGVCSRMEWGQFLQFPKKCLWDQKAASHRRTDRPLHRGGLRIALNPNYFLFSWGKGAWSVRIPNTTGRLWDDQEIMWQKVTKVKKSLILLCEWRQKRILLLWSLR